MTREPKQARAIDQIDANLKRVYDDLLHEEVPDRFTDLLAQLKAADRGNTSSGQRDDA